MTVLHFRRSTSISEKTRTNPMSGTGTRLHELISAGRMLEYSEAKRQAIAEGKDPALIEQSEANHWRAKALRELSEKVYKNPDVISGNIRLGAPEFVHVDEAVKALQRMMDDTSCTYEGCSTFVHPAHGTSHLEQALGKERAEDLLRGMYAAQRLGCAAAKKQKIAKWIGGGVVIVIIILVLLWR
jgi:hypothetical protein